MAELMNVAYIGNGLALPDGGGDIGTQAAVKVTSDVKRVSSLV